MKYIMPYMNGSKTVNKLKEETGLRTLRIENSNLTSVGHTIINWGSTKSHRAFHDGNTWFNKPPCVRNAGSKLKSFNSFKEAGISIPEFTECLDEAMLWVDDGDTVVARELDGGHSGQGIVLITPDNPSYTGDAKLFVKYVPKQQEYRVHVWGGDVLAVNRKARVRDFENPNWKIRNRKNGFIYERNPEPVDQVALDMSTAAISSLGLDFGAVDIIYNRYRNRYFVLEVNTAPGLSGELLTKYAEKIMEA